MLNLDNNILLVVNLLFYIITFFIYIRKRPLASVGSALLLFYSSLAFVSLLLFNHPYSDYLDLKLFPFIYLFALLLLSFAPILKYHEEEITSIQQPSKLAIGIVCTIVIIASVTRIIEVYTNFSSGMSEMLTNSDGGVSLYNETLENFDSQGDGKITNLASIIGNAFSDILVLFFFYFLTLEKKNKFYLGGLFLSIIIVMLTSISSGLRGSVVLLLITMIFVYLLMKNQINEIIRKKIKKIGIIFFSIISIPIVLITISRFNERDGQNDFLSYSLEWYYGQAFLNFNNYVLDSNGIRNGDRTASLFKQLVFDDTPKNYLERVDKYAHMSIDESIFSTFVGDFVLDYGATAAFFIFLFASVFFIRKTKTENGRILFHQLILLYFLLCVVVQGGIGLFTFADVSGNLRILVFILVYFWFKFDYYILQNKING